MKCPQCKKEISAQFSEKDKLHFYFCADCKIGGKGKTEKEAGDAFTGKAPAPQTTALTAPKNKNALEEWARNNALVLESRSAQFIDKPATKRMIEKNIRYVMSADLKDAWSTPEGQESISDALQDSFEIGATLPEMGSIVPFGKTVEFIPAISAYEFALTSGKNPPFKNINIECIYQNDVFEIGRKDGNFSFELKKICFPRGDVIGVVVQATETGTGRVIGEAYDEPRLMAKAEKHSKNYKYFLADMALLAKARTEGKDHIIKWEKKVYERDIQNPYSGADKPEMLKKLAGKSFFRPFMKVRNARAMEAEWSEEVTDGQPETATERTYKKTVNAVLDTALEQVKDADYREVVEPVKVEPKNELTRKADNKKLFDEE